MEVNGVSTNIYNILPILRKKREIGVGSIYISVIQTILLCGVHRPALNCASVKKQNKLQR